ncbi:MULTISPECIES: ABC transporter permease [Inquilinus]|uniref:Peptide/nickel transport system permease protein n=1 Tax=Inquilinus ginsengisoli TaxID=363840 RepID=A0ABU1JZJ9_9PROT|nr:ABC transporter permease [Inquilinus ginsengisoli]MDR6294040.1 peptide/nickel transport system permease protein [Inquilinus ginsengisoli]
MTGLMQRLWRQKKVTIGLAIVLAFVLIAVFAPLIAPYDPSARVGRPHEAPSAEHLLGTTRVGRDVLSQLVWGARTSLLVGFAGGIVITVIGTAVGLIGGYRGGRLDEVLDLATNVVLVIPNLPLLIMLAAFLGNAGIGAIVTIVALTSWPWGARVTRAQTLALRHREFVLAARLVGEPTWRIVGVEILPNLASIIGINLVGSIIYAVVAQVTLEYLGFGDPLGVSWGRMLYNAQNASAITVGAWWDIMTPCAAIALLGLGLALINFTLDEVANPQLRSGPALTRWLRLVDRRRRERKPA